MQSIHIPKLGPRYWFALCLASTSARRVRAIASIRPTSASLRGSALSLPMPTSLSSASTPRNVSHQQKRGLRQHAIDERVALRAAALEFRGRKAGGIDLPPELRFQRDQQLQHLAQQQTPADQHHIDVALRGVGPFCYGTITECRFQLRRKRHPCLPQPRLASERLSGESD